MASALFGSSSSILAKWVPKTILLYGEFVEYLVKVENSSCSAVIEISEELYKGLVVKGKAPKTLSCPPLSFAYT